MRFSLLLCAAASAGLAGCNPGAPTEPRGQPTESGTEALARAASAGKVALCHRTGSGRYQLIVVAAPAVPPHLAHGDEPPGGARFDAACVPNAQVPTRLPAAVDGIIRDGSLVLDGGTVQVLHVPTFEDRGVIEFDLSGLSGAVIQAQLQLSVYNSMGPYPFMIDVFDYAGDGALSLADWASGTLSSSFEYAGEPTVTLDVTAALQARRAAGAPFAGFTFRFAVPSPITLNGPYVAFRSIEVGPPAVLEVMTQ